MKMKTLFHVFLTIALFASVLYIYGCGSPTSGGSSGTTVPKIYISDLYNGKIYVIDPSHISTEATSEALTLIKTIEVSGAAGIGWMALHPNGLKLYAGDPGSSPGKVYIINTGTDTVTGVVTVCSGPVGMDFNTNGSKLFVACSGGSDVAIIDTAHNTHANDANDTIYGLGSANDLVYNSSNNHIYVAASGSNNIYYITAEGDTVTSSNWQTKAINSPSGLALSKDNKTLYCTSYSSTQYLNDQLASIEVAAMTVVATWPAQGDSTYGHRGFGYVSVSPDGNHVIASDHDYSYIDHINTSTGVQTGIDLTSGSPDYASIYKIAFSSNSKYAFAVDTQLSPRKLFAFDVTNCETVGSLEVATGGNLFDIIYKP